MKVSKNTFQGSRMFFQRILHDLMDGTDGRQLNLLLMYEKVYEYFFLQDEKPIMTEEVIKLKDEANELFKAGDYDKAIDICVKVR
jgi:hypothetical protein